MGKENSSEKGYWHLLGGGLGSAISCVFGQPFDLVITNSIGASSSNTHSISTTISQIYQKKGIKGFWRGTVPTLLCMVPAASFQFYFMHTYKKMFLFLKKKNYFIGKENITQNSLNSFENFCAGFLGRGTAALLINPLLVVKTRVEHCLISESKNNLVNLSGTKRITSAFVDMHKNRKYMSGAIPSLIRNAPMGGLMFMFYSYFQKSLVKAFPSHSKSSFLISFPSSSLACFFSVLITHPLDVIRTRIQLNSNIVFTQKNSQKLSLSSVISSLYKNEGIPGFWRGFFPKVTKKIFITPIDWYIVEWFVSTCLSKQKEKKSNNKLL